MVFPVAAATQERPGGHTYAAVLVRDTDVLGALREIRFSGWLAPAGAWSAAVARPADGTVAAGRRGVLGTGEWLHQRLAVPVLALRVRADRQLVLVAWDEGEPAGPYVSDPSREPDAGRDVLAEPWGAEHADGIAAACGRPEAASDLAEVLAEELDPDSVIESERLGRVLRLLGLPTWLVAVSALPRPIPTGPEPAEVTRLGAGVPGLLGYPAGRAASVVRRRRPPPPVLADPPRGPDMDPWLM